MTDPRLSRETLAALEGGAVCMLFASGSAAITAVFQSLLPGDHVLVSRILYWGTRRWLAEFGIAWGLDVEFVDTSDVAAVRRAIRPGRSRLLWLDTSDGRIRLRLEGGCQGCSLAEVTLRQGVEPLLRRHVPEVTVVVDATDHAASTSTFFAPRKR